MQISRYLALLSLSVLAAAQESFDDVTEVDGCHAHGEAQYCFVLGEDLEVTTDIDVDTAPESYSGCHTHGDELHCTGDGQDVSLALPSSATSTTASSDSGSTTESSDSEHDHESESTDEVSTVASDEISCHDHAGIPHCVDAEGNTVEQGCSRPDYDYNVPLRIGLLFVILVGSAIGVFIPIIAERFTKIRQDSIIFIGLRQFGTGVIISTAMLFTHAELYFSNECLGGLEYEATTAAIAMAGLFLTFLIEFVAHRFGGGHSHDHDVVSSGSPTRSDDKTVNKDSERVAIEGSSGRNLVVNTAVVEAGIIFHSILLGIVLVVAGDAGFITLFVVILFHQAFEGIALGTRIAIMPGGFIRKIILGGAFAITTPIGMAIGIGVLSKFNGNDPSTIIAIGTLNAFSAGILLWIGITEMWFKEWFYGPLARAGPAKIAVGFFGLVAGLVIMSVIGKWA